jgi:hypothetical protein
MSMINVLMLVVGLSIIGVMAVSFILWIKELDQETWE